MIRIGIIGSIGSGKSFIAKLFKFPVFNADNEVESIYKNSRGCFNKLKKKIPKYIKSFPVKKSELITAINKDKNNLIKISSVVHPLVRKKLKIFVKKYKKSEMVVLDIPLLIENKLNNKDDILIFVKSNKKKILNRLKKRRNYNKKLIRNLNENQALISKKKKLANFVVDNDFHPNIMKKKIKFLKNKILDERNRFRY